MNDSEVFYSEEAIDDLYSIILEERPVILDGDILYIPDMKPSNHSRTAIVNVLSASNERRTKDFIKKFNSMLQEGIVPTEEDLYPTTLFEREDLEKMFSGDQELLPLYINDENPYLRSVAKWRLKRGI